MHAQLLWPATEPFPAESGKNALPFPSLPFPLPWARAPFRANRGKPWSSPAVLRAGLLPSTTGLARPMASLPRLLGGSHHAHHLKWSTAQGKHNLARDVATGAWTKNTIQDTFFLRAKKEGYLSRAAYKLKEIQQKHKLIKPGNHVLDLGCSPGAWMQVACQEIGPKERGGLVLGVDIQAVTVPERFCDTRVKVLQADARTLAPSVLTGYAPEGFDCVLSDMLHSTSGAGNDVDLSLELAGAALHIATGWYFDTYGEEYAQRMGFRHSGYLRPGGSLVMKVYEGAGVTEFIRDMQKYFTKVVRMRVDASRSMSREFYAVGLGRKRPAAPKA